MPTLKARLSVIRTPQKRAVQRVVLDGIISSPTIVRFRRITDKALASGRDMILDMRGVRYINSSGLAELVRIHDVLQQQNLSLIVVNLDTEVKRLVMMLGLRTILLIFPSTKRALESLDRGMIKSQALEPGDTTRYFLQRGKAFVPVKRPPPPRLPEARILLGMRKDDHFGHFLALCLTGNGGQTVTADSHDEAIKVMGEQKVDIAILDGSLAAADSICGELKTSRANGLVSVIVVYPEEPNEATRPAVRICEDEYAVEPFEVREMIVTAQSEYGRCRNEAMLFDQEVKLEVATQEEALAHANQIVEKLLRQSGLGHEATDGFFYAVREALDNARVHGNLRDGTKRIELIYVLDKEKVTVTVTDAGAGFDFVTALETVRAQSPVEQARTRQENGERGGLGIGLMLRCCDKLEYIPPGNAVRLTRYL